MYSNNYYTLGLISACTSCSVPQIRPLLQCSLQDFAIGGYILECTEYLHHNLMRFVNQVIILVALVVYNR